MIGHVEKFEMALELERMMTEDKLATARLFFRHKQAWNEAKMIYATGAWDDVLVFKNVIFNAWVIGCQNREGECYFLTDENQFEKI